MEFVIRQELNSDYAAVFDVVKEAFATAEQSDGTEQDLVSALRASASFIPSLSLVAASECRIVGHILFTKITVQGETGLALAPLSVLPAYQKQGIGSALIKEGHRIAGELGYAFSVVLGNPKVYQKMGYRPARLYGIFPPLDVPDENFMAVPLGLSTPLPKGVVHYDPAFGIE